MFSTAREFLNNVFFDEFWRIRDGRDEKHKYWLIRGDASDPQVPILGAIGESRYHMVDVEKDRSESMAVYFYLVDQLGNEYRPEPHGEPPAELVSLLSKTSMPGELLKELVLVSSNGVCSLSPQSDMRDEYVCGLICLRESVLRRLLKETGLVVVVDQSYYSHFGDKARRTVFPAEVRVHEMAKQIDVGSMEIQYIKHHQNCVEYRAKTGEQIFDHRVHDYDCEGHLATSITLWRVGFRRYVNRVIATIDKGDQAKQLLVRLLHNLAGDDHSYGMRSDQKMNLINDILVVLTGSEYFPLSALLSVPGYEYEIRKAYKNARWDSILSQNVFNPEYILLRDKKNPGQKSPEQKGVATINLGDCPSIR